ncbi:MAG: hypothetical protein QXG10_03920 [Candidatus Hadarchaeales archaeon]
MYDGRDELSNERHERLVTIGYWIVFITVIIVFLTIVASVFVVRSPQSIYASIINVLVVGIVCEIMITVGLGMAVFHVVNDAGKLLLLIGIALKIGLIVSILLLPVGASVLYIISTISMLVAYIIALTMVGEKKPAV